jgi:hypothetical protein
MVVLGAFVQVDKINGFYFLQYECLPSWLMNFVLSNQTEAGSAGEQPVRDRLDA